MACSPCSRGVDFVLKEIAGTRTDLGEAVISGTVANIVRVASLAIVASRALPRGKVRARPGDAGRDGNIVQII